MVLISLTYLDPEVPRDVSSGLIENFCGGCTRANLSTEHARRDRDFPRPTLATAGSLSHPDPVGLVTHS